MIAYTPVSDVKTRNNTPPAPYADESDAAHSRTAAAPGTRRFLLAVETNLKDPPQAAVFNTWYNDVHIPDVLTSPGYRGVVRLDRVTPEAPGRGPSMTLCWTASSASNRSIAASYNRPSRAGIRRRSEKGWSYPLKERPGHGLENQSRSPGYARGTAMSSVYPQ